MTWATREPKVASRQANKVSLMAGMTLIHSPIRAAMALCALVLALGAATAHAAKPERIPMAVRCETLGERSRESDCHSFDIFVKRAFFDSPLPYRLRSHAEGITTWPVVSVTVLIYREGTPAPDLGEEHYRWDYRGLAFWSLTDAGKTKPYVGDWFDLSSGREFVGGSVGARDSALMRNPLYQALATELPMQLHSAYRRVRSEGAPAPEPAPGMNFKRNGTYQGACGEQFGTSEKQKMLEHGMSLLGQSLLFTPNLENAPGPWEAVLLPCAGGTKDLVLRVRGKNARAEAACTLAEPLILSDTEGVIAQCALQMGKSLRKDLVAAAATAK